MNRHWNTRERVGDSRLLPVLSCNCLQKKNYVKTASFLHSLVLFLNMDFKCKSQLACHFDGRCAIYHKKEKKMQWRKERTIPSLPLFFFCFSFLGLTVRVQKWIAAITPRGPALSVWRYLNNTIWHVHCYKLAVLRHRWHEQQLIFWAASSTWTTRARLWKRLESMTGTCTLVQLSSGWDKKKTRHGKSETHGPFWMTSFFFFFCSIVAMILNASPQGSLFCFFVCPF